MSTDLAIPGSVTETSLQLPADLPFDDWRQTGETLGRISRASQWWIGDWLNYGERAYGEKYSEAIAATGYELGTLKNFAYVAAKVETSRRRDVLSWSHHQEAAAFGPADQDRWLGSAEANGWSKGRLRNKIREQEGLQAQRDEDRELVESTEVVGELAGLPINKVKVNETKWRRQRVEKTKERLAVGVFAPIQLQATELSRFRGGDFYQAALEEMPADWLREYSAEIVEARKNLLDLQRDVDRALGGRP